MTRPPPTSTEGVAGGYGPRDGAGDVFGELRKMGGRAARRVSSCSWTGPADRPGLGVTSTSVSSIQLATRLFREPDRRLSTWDVLAARHAGTALAHAGL